MKVVILAGGLGTRISEYTKTIPKPMIKICGKPIIHRIIDHYVSYGHNEFYIALGYKGFFIKKFFLDYNEQFSDLTIDFKNNKILKHNETKESWEINLIDTGEQTPTGGRIKKIMEFIGDERVMVTYGDGLCNLNIKQLLEFHNNHKKLATITAVRPSARFGELELEGDKITSFKEKPQSKKGWINGGFFVFNYKVFDFIKGDKTMLEKEPLQKLAKIGQLAGFKHEGFWQCMDTMRDKAFLNKLVKQNKIPWK